MGKGSVITLQQGICVWGQQIVLKEPLQYLGVLFSLEGVSRKKKDISRLSYKSGDYEDSHHCKGQDPLQISLSKKGNVFLTSRVKGQAAFLPKYTQGFKCDQ
jgi:hypothetical protein